jgi:hypothetical protein
MGKVSKSLVSAGHLYLSGMTTFLTTLIFSVISFCHASTLTPKIDIDILPVHSPGIAVPKNLWMSNEWRYNFYSRTRQSREVLTFKFPQIIAFLSLPEQNFPKLCFALTLM